MPRLLHLLEHIHLCLPGDDVDIFDLVREAQTPGPQFVADVKYEEDGDGDIGGQEVGGVELVRPEDLEAVGQGDQTDEEQDEPCCVGLQWRLVRNRVIHSVGDHGFPEPEVGDHRNDPCDVAGDCRDVHEPSEDSGARVRQVEEGEQPEYPGEADSNIRDALLVRDAKELWRLAVG